MFYELDLLDDRSIKKVKVIGKYVQVTYENEEITQYYLFNEDRELEPIDEPVKRRRKKINR